MATAPFFSWRQLALFTVVFTLALLVQISRWFPAGVTDEILWSTAAVETAREGPWRPQHDYGTTTLEIDPAFIYPGTTIILPASALDYAGVEPKKAIRASFALVMAFFIALASSVLAWLRPRALHWVPGTVLLILGPFYQVATVGSAAAVPLAALIALSYLAVEERARQGDVPISMLAFTGAAGGLAAATRLDAAAFVFGSAFVALCFSVRWRAALAALAALATFLILDPYLWPAPLQYMSSMHASMLRQETFALQPSALVWAEEFVLPVPLAALSFLLYACALFAPRLLPVPRRFAVWLVASTLLMCAVLLLASSRRLWYFYPFFALWEIFLPLIVVGLLEAMPQGKTRPGAVRLLALLSMGALIAVYAWPAAL